MKHLHSWSLMWPTVHHQQPPFRGLQGSHCKQASLGRAPCLGICANPLGAMGFTGNVERIDTEVWVRGQAEESPAQEEGKEEGDWRKGASGPSRRWECPGRLKGPPVILTVDTFLVSGEEDKSRDPDTRVPHLYPPTPWVWAVHGRPGHWEGASRGPVPCRLPRHTGSNGWAGRTARGSWDPACPSTGHSQPQPPATGQAQMCV